MRHMPTRAEWTCKPYNVAHAAALEDALGLSPAVAAIIVRRGLGGVDEARAFLAAILGAVIFGVIVSGATIPGQDDTGLVQALIAVPGAVAGLAVSWFYGSRTEGEHRPEVL